MWVSLFKRRYIVPVCGLIAVATSVTAVADPFSAAFTSRESKRISSILSVAPFTRTYQALTDDSKDLTFQEATNGRTVVVYASKDEALDNAGADKCRGSGTYSIFWADRYQNLPAECLSFSDSTGDTANAHSERPVIGGTGRDFGRYVAYETDASDIATFAGTADPHQVILHDRKWTKNFPSSSKCDVTGFAVKGANAPLHVWQLSDDGKNMLMTTAATNMRDNLLPTCEDEYSYSDLFIRDGSDCNASMRGACKTSILYDRYGYHADPNLKETLNADSQNARMTPDQAVVVFDTAATNPLYFSADIKGFRDVYYHINNTFTRITEAVIPFCDVLGNVRSLTNEYGPANNHSENPDVDQTGRYVVFESLATDLVVWEGNPAMRCVTPGAPHPADIQYLQTNGLRQIYLYDHLTKRIELISKKYRSSSATRAQGGNGNSFNPRISRDGRFIIFESFSTDFLQAPTTSVKNIFMYDRYLDSAFLVTPGVAGTGLDKNATLTDISPAGLTVAFETKAKNVLVEGPEEGTTAGGTLANCGATAEACNHVYLARNSCPLDTDGDLVADCLDACSNDRGKTQPGLCGCGVAETDTDRDFTPDCIDGCDSDANKVVAGVCGCGVADTDADGDGTPNCVDTCPTDNQKTRPGICGCGVADADSDGDGSFNCNDSCPTDPNKKGTDGCACGTLKDTPGVCGCNVLDTDANGNGQADCLDPGAATAPAIPSYDVSRLGIGRSTLTILRIKMQGFGGKVTYSYSLTRNGYKLQKTSKTNTVVVRGLRPGTYSFSYSVTVGSGATKATTKVTNSSIQVK
jgi:hypothetical protein